MVSACRGMHCLYRTDVEKGCKTIVLFGVGFPLLCLLPVSLRVRLTVTNGTGACRVLSLPWRSALSVNPPRKLTWRPMLPHCCVPPPKHAFVSPPLWSHGPHPLTNVLRAKQTTTHSTQPPFSSIYHPTALLAVEYTTCCTHRRSPALLAARTKRVIAPFCSVFCIFMHIIYSSSSSGED